MDTPWRPLILKGLEVVLKQAELICGVSAGLMVPMVWRWCLEGGQRGFQEVGHVLVIDLSAGYKDVPSL